MLAHGGTSSRDTGDLNARRPLGERRKLLAMALASMMTESELETIARDCLYPIAKRHQLRRGDPIAGQA
jgi:hypothetical protein